MDKGSHISNERIFNTHFGRQSEELLNLLGKKQTHFLIVSGDKEMIRMCYSKLLMVYTVQVMYYY